MLEDPDFDGKPLVMLIGQYSTGKTTFIRWFLFVDTPADDMCLALVCVWPSIASGHNFGTRYLLEKDFPGMRIGPEPTTDNFHIIR